MIYCVLLIVDSHPEKSLDLDPDSHEIYIAPLNRNPALFAYVVDPQIGIFFRIRIHVSVILNCGPGFGSRRPIK
jgi:hypothetical protein